MNMTNKEYSKFVTDRQPHSPVVKDTLFAFLFGGGICLLGKGLTELYMLAGAAETVAKTCSTISLIFLSGLSTALGFYDNIAKVAGAGIVVPITGFANSVVSPAMEFHSEGLVLGLGAKMFIVAGPVIVFGLISSVLYGIIYWIAGVI